MRFGNDVTPSQFDGLAVPRQRVAIDVIAGRVERISGIDDAQAVVLAQESLPVLYAGLDVVMSLRIGEVGVDSGVGQRAVLGDGRGLQVGGP